MREARRRNLCVTKLTTKNDFVSNLSLRWENFMLMNPFLKLIVGFYDLPSLSTTPPQSQTQHLGRRLQKALEEKTVLTFGIVIGQSSLFFFF
jgi:hypothetical protein